MRSYRSQNSEFFKFLRAFFKIGRYIFLVGFPVGIGLFMFNKFTPSPEEIRKQYEKDPLSKKLYQDSMRKQNEIRRAAFIQAGIIDPDDPNPEETLSKQ